MGWLAVCCMQLTTPNVWGSCWHESHMVYAYTTPALVQLIVQPQGAADISLFFCVFCSATTACNVTAGKLQNGLDLCTREGVLGGTSTNDSASGSCKLSDSAACSAGMFCSDKPQIATICTCVNGADTCDLYGTCAPTPCKQCGDCVAQLQNYVTGQLAATDSTAAQVADAFSAYCGTNLTCTAVSDAIRKTANIGRRAGTLCSLLGRC